jgi:DNA-binding transcriptional MerR regulator
MEAYRIEDLARESGTTVRTIRAYQDRGLLPKPERRGRANVYGPAHLARLRQIAGLLDRGYTLASIKELLEAWDAGTGLGGVLGLLDVMHEPWSNERPVRIRRSVLTETFGGRNDEAIAEAIALGVLEPVPASGGGQPGSGADGGGDAGRAAEGGSGPGSVPETGTGPGSDCGPACGSDSGHACDADSGSGAKRGARRGRRGTSAQDDVGEEDEEYLVPSPQELTVAAELHAAGVPLLAISGHLRELRGDVEHIAERFLHFTIDHVFHRFLDHTPSEAEATEAADLVRRLRPLAQQTLDAELARAMHALTSGLAQRRHTDSEPELLPMTPLAAALAAARAEPVNDPAHVNVLLPVSTVRAVRDLVGARQAAAFITAAAEREVQARTLDALTANHREEGSG